MREEENANDIIFKQLERGRVERVHRNDELKKAIRNERQKKYCLEWASTNVQPIVRRHAHLLCCAKVAQMNSRNGHWTRI